MVGLISDTVQRNSFGEEISTGSTVREVYANRKSIRQSEFYQSFGTGLKPEIVFEVMYEEYQGEKMLKADMPNEGEIDLHILRTFTKNQERLELVCSRYPMEG